MVGSLAQLQTELENGGTYAALELVLTTVFPIASTISIQNNQTVSITSDAGGPYTLTREANGTLINNFQTGSGGAISVSNGTLYMTGGRVAGNRSSFGGGINIATSFLAIPTYNVSDDSFIAGNIAPNGNGGAIGFFMKTASNCSI